MSISALDPQFSDSQLDQAFNLYDGCGVDRLHSDPNTRFDRIAFDSIIAAGLTESPEYHSWSQAALHDTWVEAAVCAFFCKTSH